MNLSCEEIDFNYIENFEKKEEEYNILYKTNINNININIHYLKNYKIINTISFECKLQDKVFNSETLLYLIKKYSQEKYSQEKYIFDLIIFFNFNIDNNEIKQFMNNNIPIYNYFQVYKNIVDLNINDTISFFSDINSIDIYLKNKISIKNKKFNKTNKIKRTSY